MIGLNIMAVETFEPPIVASIIMEQLGKKKKWKRQTIITLYRFWKKYFKGRELRNLAPSLFYLSIQNLISGIYFKIQ